QRDLVVVLDPQQPRKYAAELGELRPCSGDVFAQSLGALPQQLEHPLGWKPRHEGQAGLEPGVLLLRLTQDVAEPALELRAAGGGDPVNRPLRATTGARRSLSLNGAVP